MRRDACERASCLMLRSQFSRHQANVGLKEVDLQGNGLGDKGQAALKKVQQVPRLKHVCVHIRSYSFSLRE